MTISLPVWGIFLLISLALLIFAFSRPSGYWGIDFGRFIVLVCVIVFWIAWGLSKIF